MSGLGSGLGVCVGVSNPAAKLAASPVREDRWTEGLFALGISGVVRKVELWSNSDSQCENLQEFRRDEQLRPRVWNRGVRGVHSRVLRRDPPMTWEAS